MVLYAALGFAEDVAHLSVAVRMTGQFAIAFAAGVVAVAWSSGLLGPEVLLPAAVLGLVLGLSAVFVVNAANFMDGINGISALHGVIAGGNAWIIGILSGWDDLILTGSLVLAAFLGFLGWNFPKARMFLGDSGSYLLGAAQWGLGWAAFAATGNPVVGLAPVAIYSVDVVVTLVRRAIRRVNLTQSHREHGYQLIAAACGSHVPATVITTIASALNCGLAIWSWQAGNLWLGVFGMLLVCLGYELIALVWVPRRAKP
jgi:UDP-N-acetylmuramyl pentapeptide phosphotransferase/UDP-N-acetylglucosamine-1-phosphate transferase